MYDDYAMQQIYIYRPQVIAVAVATQLNAKWNLFTVLHEKVESQGSNEFF